MVKLVISASMMNMPSLAGAINAFHEERGLFWLGKVEGCAAQNVPVIAKLEDLAEFEGSVFIVAPEEECIASPALAGRLMRIIERGTVDKNGKFATIELDCFEQLEILSTITRYTGLGRLLKQNGWSAGEYRAAVLARYANALDCLRLGRKAAVFSAQRLGQLVCDSLQSGKVAVQAFIDNNTAKHGTHLSGIPVSPLSDITDKELPIVIATTRFPTSISRQLESEGYRHVLPYSVMSLVDPALYPEEIPYLGIQEDFAQHIANYVGLFLCLADDKSRIVLDGLLNYRLDYDSKSAEAVADEYSRQYFDAELIKFSRDDVFVDLGGYDGDTAEKFIQFGGGTYRKIYLFEPDVSLLKAAEARLAEHSNIEYIQAGAYSVDGELRFSASGRTNGSISESGELVIPVRKLDSVIDEPPTLIKMDIEGSETEALRGAERLLKTVRPRLAIAAYHFAPDLWRLVDVVRGMNPTYKFYLRHYSENGLESVIYAL